MSASDAIRRAAPVYEVAAVDHHEASIEGLFRQHLAQAYGSSLDVSAAAAASSERLRAIWEQRRPPVTFERFAEDVLAALQYAYDRKYGDWDQVNDLRVLFPDTWHAAILPYTTALRPDARVLGVGVNDGREVRQLLHDRRTQVDLLDLSAKAVGRIARQLDGYSRIRAFVGTFEDWVPAHRGYDLIFALRTLNCTSVDRIACVRKSIELVRPGGTLIFSVSNGYIHVEDGIPTAVPGMFSELTGRIDVDRPLEIANEIRDAIEGHGARVLELTDSPAEIFIVATTDPRG